MRTVQDIADELERRLRPLLVGGDLEISDFTYSHDPGWVIRLLFTPEPGGPGIRLDLLAPDRSEPIVKLTVKPIRTIPGKPEPKSKSGPARTIVDSIVDWFTMNRAELFARSVDNPKTSRELQALISRELGKLPGINFEVAQIPTGVQIEIAGPHPMTFLVGPSDYPSPPSPGELPMMMKLSGKGALKFRSFNGPRWDVVGVLVKWIKANTRLLQASWTRMPDRIVAAYTRQATDTIRT